MKQKKKKKKKSIVNEDQADKIAIEQERKKANNMEIRRLKELQEDLAEYIRRSRLIEKGIH